MKVGDDRNTSVDVVSDGDCSHAGDDLCDSETLVGFELAVESWVVLRTCGLDETLLNDLGPYSLRDRSVVLEESVHSWKTVFRRWEIIWNRRLSWARRIGRKAGEHTTCLLVNRDFYNEETKFGIEGRGNSHFRGAGREKSRILGFSVNPDFWGNNNVLGVLGINYGS